MTQRAWRSSRGVDVGEAWRGGRSQRAAMSLDEEESDEQTAEILLCFYETYEPVVCTEEKVQRIMRSFKKRAEKSGENWRTIMYAEFVKAKGVHPRTFYEQQAQKDGRLPEWMDLEASESTEAKARANARRALKAT